MIPQSIKQRYWRYLEEQESLRRLRARFGVDDIKYIREIDFWNQRFHHDNGKFKNDHYEKIFLGMAGEKDDAFCADKIVADFGCGPRGSLHWIKGAKAKIGIDVLSDQYARFNLHDHDMCYICSTENWIPLPSGYVQVLFTLNALDHVHHLKTLCKELLRILAVGGKFFGAFNLNEPATETEPQRLTEELLEFVLFRNLQVTWRLTTAKPKAGRGFDHFLHGTPPQAPNSPGQPCILFVRAEKVA